MQAAIDLIFLNKEKRHQRGKPNPSIAAELKVERVINDL